MTAHKKKRSKSFKTGLTILLINTPLCYLAMIITSAIAARTGNLFWVKISAFIFILSWILFGTGLLLAGRGALEEVKNIWKKLFKFKKTDNKEEI